MVRGSRVAYSLTSILAAWLFWTWPDAASVVVAVMFSLTLMYIGIALLAKGVRHHFPAGRGSRRRTQATLIVQVVGSALALALVSSAIFGTVRIQSDSAAVDEFYTW
jgi:ABC-type phosphate transport system auxiliary subunit